MKLFSSAAPTLGVAGLAVAMTLVGCVIEEAPPRRLADDPNSPSGTVAPAPGTSAATPSSPAPMLVVLDTDQVMNADPGQGVGIFAEYATGGRWHVWWTCDTAKSRQDCDVSLSVTAATGTLSRLDAAELQGGVVTSPTPSRAEARIRTTNEVHGLSFTTNPGAVITLEATIGGLKEAPGANGSFFFFVQDAKINGGFTGRLTNPLQLQGKTP